VTPSDLAGLRAMLGYLVPLAFMVVGVAYLAVAMWLKTRSKEREAYYAGETAKKMAESSGEGASAALAYLREQHRLANRHRVEGMKLGGLITAAVGIGSMVFLRGVQHTGVDPVYLAGTIPFLIGVAMLIYAYVLAPKDTGPAK